MGLNRNTIDALPSVHANLNYLIPGSDKPYRYTYEPPAGVLLDNQSYASHPVRIRDAREVAAGVSLDEEGFALVRHRTAVRDFYNESEIRGIFYAEAEALLKEATGADSVHVFDHIVRRRATDRPPLDAGRPAGNGPRGPVGRVHNDFTAKSARTRLRVELGAQAEELLSRHFAIINVWRSIKGPVIDAPLAVCDARSIAPEDLVASDLIYRERVGEVYQVVHNDAHRWFYISALKPDEALLLKGYDSAEDGRARFAPHSAFEDPNTPSDAPPRESIEVRAFIFYPD